MKLRELQEKRAYISEQLMELCEQRMNTQQRTKFDALSKEADELGGDIARVQKAEGLDIQLRQRPNRAIAASFGSEWESAPRINPSGSILSFPDGAEDRAYSQNFDRFLRSGERRDGLALSTPTQSTGTSVLVSQDFGKQIENALLFSGSMLKLATVIPTPTGAPLPLPTANDTAQSATIVGEGQVTTESDPSLSAVVLGAFKYSTGLVKVSIELAQDSAFDLSSWLAEQFGLRLRRKLNSDFTIGAGSTLPYGILTQATLGRTAVGSAGNTGGSETGLDTIGSDDLLALMHSVDPLYRDRGVFQAHDLTIQSIMSVKDKYGRPLFQPPDVGQPASIFGKPIFCNNDLDPITVDSPLTARKTVIFGDHSKYVIRQVKDLSVLRLVERYAEYGQIGFIGFARFDGNLIDAGTHPVKYLQQATS